MLNALQANPADPKIGVRLHAESNGNGLQGLQIEVQDNGGGFTPEAAQKAARPFSRPATSGSGLGLTVSRKIIETHHGKLEIVPPKSGQAGLVRISLPLDAPAPALSTYAVRPSDVIGAEDMGMSAWRRRTARRMPGKDVARLRLTASCDRDT